MLPLMGRRVKPPKPPLLPEVAELPAVPDAALQRQLSGRAAVRAEVEGLIEDEVLNLMRAEVRSKALLDALGVPANLEGAAADQWASEQMPQMRVLALAIQHYLMRFGSLSQATRASEQIIAITEREKGLPGTAPLVLINVPAGAAVTPWERKQQAALEDAVVVSDA
jgi:hypothetical protein